MRIVLSALVSDLKGKLGGTVFQRTQGGLSVRSQPGVKKGWVQGVQINKGFMLTLMRNYSTFTAAQINMWEQYAIYLNKKQQSNNQLSLSGQSLFIYQQMRRFQGFMITSGVTPQTITDPVIQPDPLPITIEDLILNFSDLDVLLSRALDSTNEYLLIKMSRPLLPSQKSGYAKKVIIPYVEEDDIAVNVAPAYLAYYGRLPVAGEFVNCSIAIGMKTTNGISSELKARIEVSGP